MKRVYIKKYGVRVFQREKNEKGYYKYLKEREEILKNANEEKDYDHIDMAEFRNYLCCMNLEINHLKPQEKHEQMIKFYNSKVQASLL